MTSTRKHHAERARTVIGSTLETVDALLLDFDGPICDLFGRYPSESIAAEARALLLASGIDLPPPLMTARGALVILRWVEENCSHLTSAVEAIQDQGEMLASQTATATPSCAATMIAATRSGLSIAVVSNNSAESIASYLSRTELDEYVGAVIGRTAGNARLMKPNPEPVLRAAGVLGVSPKACLMVGDAPTDIEAAKLAGVRTIGYATTNRTLSALNDAGADAVIDDMSVLTNAIDALSPA